MEPSGLPLVNARAEALMRLMEYLSSKRFERRPRQPRSLLPERSWVGWVQSAREVRGTSGSRANEQRKRRRGVELPKEPLENFVGRRIGIQWRADFTHLL